MPGTTDHPFTGPPVETRYGSCSYACNYLVFGAAGGSDPVFTLQNPDSFSLVGHLGSIPGNLPRLGSSFPDTMNGSPRTDVLTGLGGDDTISAGGGSDFVLADPGNDRIDGGGSSGDTIDFAASPRRVSVNLGSGKASGFGADVVTGFEHVAGTKYADVLTGNAAANRLQGGAGNDRLLGGGGRDTLTGQQGRDFADGGPARDICSAELKKRCP